MKKAFVDKKYCVACGCCLTACKVGAVRLWLLQRDADLYLAWTYHNDFIQASLLVCVLPDGNDDADDLQDQSA